MIGFISASVTHSLLITFTGRQCSAIADLQTFRFTVSHALGFSLSTSRLLATDLNTGIITVSLNHTLQILHIKLLFTDVLSKLALFFPTHNGTPSPGNGSQHGNYNSLIKSHSPNITHKNFSSQMYSRN
jgi:hypothetical protein